MNQKEKSEITKRKIAEASLKMFGTKGYEQTSVADIAKEIQLTKGAVYHHFESKEKILEYVTMMTQQKMINQVAEIVYDEKEDVDGKVKKIIQYFIESKQEQILLQNSWVERVPFALLNTIRISNRELVPYFLKLIMIKQTEIKNQTKYVNEIAEIMVLLFDVWLDPIIFERTSTEIFSRLEFILDMLNRFDIELISEENFELLKKLYMR